MAKRNNIDEAILGTSLSTVNELLHGSSLIRDMVSSLINLLKDDNMFLIKTSNGYEDTLLPVRLEMGRKFNMEIAKQRQNELVASCNDDVRMANEEFAKFFEHGIRIQKDVDEAFENYEMSKSAYEEAKERLDEITDIIEEARIKLEEKMLYSQLESIYRNEMNQLVLVHPSATIGQLKKFGNYTTVVTYVDVPEFEQLGIGDSIFSKKKSMSVCIEDFTAKYGGSTPEANKSRMEFVRAAAWYKINEIPIEIIFKDPILEDMLKELDLLEGVTEK